MKILTNSWTTLTLIRCDSGKKENGNSFNSNIVFWNLLNLITELFHNFGQVYTKFVWLKNEPSATAVCVLVLLFSVRKCRPLTPKQYQEDEENVWLTKL